MSSTRDSVLYLIKPKRKQCKTSIPTARWMLKLLRELVVNKVDSNCIPILALSSSSVRLIVWTVSVFDTTDLLLAFFVIDVCADRDCCNGDTDGSKSDAEDGVNNNGDDCESNAEGDDMDSNETGGRVVG